MILVVVLWTDQTGYFLMEAVVVWGEIELVWWQDGIVDRKVEVWVSM